MIRQWLIKRLAREDIKDLCVTDLELRKKPNGAQLVITINGPAEDVCRLANSIGWLLIVKKGN